MLLRLYLSPSFRDECRASSPACRTVEGLRSFLASRRWVRRPPTGLQVCAEPRSCDTVCHAVRSGVRPPRCPRGLCQRASAGARRDPAGTCTGRDRRLAPTNTMQASGPAFCYWCRCWGQALCPGCTGQCLPCLPPCWRFIRMPSVCMGMHWQLWRVGAAPPHGGGSFTAAYSSCLRTPFS